MHVNKKENQNKNPGCNSLWLLHPGFYHATFIILGLHIDSFGL